MMQFAMRPNTSLPTYQSTSLHLKRYFDRASAAFVDGGGEGGAVIGQGKTVGEQGRGVDAALRQPAQRQIEGGDGFALPLDDIVPDRAQQVHFLIPHRRQIEGHAV